ncbi:MAG TPA: universal stress protein, partial [Gemmatimonadales bacterium]
GSPARVLAEHARAKHAGLIVMTTHGHSGVSRLWLGSVADQLLRRVSVPVLLLHPKHAAYSEFRHILVALDGSQNAEQVLKTAVDLGSLMPEVRYTLVRVVEPPLPVITRLAVYPAPPPRSQAEEESCAVAYLQSLAAPLLERGLQVSTEVLSGRSVADRIQEAAHARGADLIVVGTHGASGLERMMLGSVADKIVRGTTHPVLVVPTRGEHHRPSSRQGRTAIMTDVPLPSQSLVTASDLAIR